MRIGFEQVNQGVANVYHYFFKPLFYHGSSRLPPIFPYPAVNLRKFLCQTKRFNLTYYKQQSYNLQ